MTPGRWTGSTRKQRLPPNWRQLRAFVLDRDNHTCQRCGRHATEVDHITPGDDHQPTNLAAICVDCHRDKSAAEGVAARASKRAKLTRAKPRHPGLH